MNSFLGSLKAKVGLGRDDGGEPDEGMEEPHGRMDDARPLRDDEEGFDMAGAGNDQGQGQDATFDDRNHMYVQGVDLGKVNPGAISGSEDVLNMLHIDARVDVPEDVYLPQDLQEGRFQKFDDESPGFSKEQVAAFFDRTQLSAEYLQKMLGRRTQDIMKLVKYINEISGELQEKMLESEVQQSSGMNLIAGDDNQTIIALTKKNQNLQAQLEAYRNGDAGANDSNLQESFSVLKKKYDELQDQLGLEQHTNRELSEELEDLKSRMAIKDEESGNDLDRLTENINNVDAVNVPDMGDMQEIELDDRPSRKTRHPAARQSPGREDAPVRMRPAPKTAIHHGGPAGARPQPDGGRRKGNAVSHDDGNTHHTLSLKSAKARPPRADDPKPAKRNGIEGDANRRMPRQTRQVKISRPAQSKRPAGESDGVSDNDVISFD